MTIGLALVVEDGELSDKSWDGVSTAKAKRELEMTGSAPDPMDEPTPDDPPRLPHWVKLLTLGAVVVVVALVLVMLLVGGEHGPEMHGG